MVDLIGREYDRVSWNCATLVAQHFGFELAPGEEWGTQFVLKVRRHFVPIARPVDGALVLMTGADHEQHVGVLQGATVLHADPMAQTCRTPLSLIKRQFQAVRFYQWQA